MSDQNSVIAPPSNGDTLTYSYDEWVMCNLYERGAYPAKVIFNYMNKLMKGSNYDYVNRLCCVLEMVGWKLSKARSLTRYIGYLLLIKSQSSTSSKIPPCLESLFERIVDIQDSHLDDWIYEIPDKRMREKLNLSDDPSIEPPSKEFYPELYEEKMIAEYVHVECKRLLQKFIKKHRAHAIKTFKDIEGLLSQGIRSLLRQDEITFVVSLTLAAIEKDENACKFAGVLLADLCDLNLLSKYLVPSGFDVIHEGYDGDETGDLLEEVYVMFKTRLTTLSQPNEPSEVPSEEPSEEPSEAPSEESSED